MTVPILTPRPRYFRDGPPGLMDILRNIRDIGSADCTASGARFNHGSNSVIDNLDAQSWLFLLNPRTINNANKRVLWKNAGTQGFQMQQGPFGGTQGRFNYTRNRATTSTAITAANDTLKAGIWQYVGITDQDGVVPRIFWGTLTAWLAEISSYATQTTGVGAPLDEAAQNLFIGSRDTVNTESDCFLAVVWAYRRILSLREFRLHQCGPWFNLGDDCVLHVLYGLGAGRAIDWSGRGNHGNPDSTVPPLRRGPLFPIPKRRTSVRVPVGAALEAAVTCSVSASAGLTTSIALLGSVSVAVTPIAVLTTSIALAGTATTTVTTTAALTTAIALAGAVSSIITLTGVLTTSIALAATSVVQVVGTGALTTSISLASITVVSIQTAGAFTTAIALAGAAVLTISVAGDLLSTYVPARLIDSRSRAFPGLQSSAGRSLWMTDSRSHPYAGT